MTILYSPSLSCWGLWASFRAGVFGLDKEVCCFCWGSEVGQSRLSGLLLECLEKNREKRAETGKSRSGDMIYCIFFLVKSLVFWGKNSLLKVVEPTINSVVFHFVAGPFVYEVILYHFG